MVERERLAPDIPQGLDQAVTLFEQRTRRQGVSLTQASHSQQLSCVSTQPLVFYLAPNGQGLLQVRRSHCEVTFEVGQHARTIKRPAPCSAAIEAIAVCQHRRQPRSPLV